MRRFQIHKISTKLILTYSLIVFLIFVCMCMVSLSSLNRQYKRELIRSDKEALHQISNSIAYDRFDGRKDHKCLLGF